MGIDRAREIAVRLYQGGASINMAAKAVGVTGPTVRRWLDAAGVPVRYSRPTYPAAMRDEAVQLYLSREMSAKGVAQEMGLRAFTVKQWLTDAGVIRSQSEAAALANTHGRRRYRASSRLWYRSTKTGAAHFAESSLEYLRMGQLDADPAVTEWGRSLSRIKYVAPCGKARHYVPDFHVLRGGRVYVEEVKPRELLSDPVTVAKSAAAESYCARRGWTYMFVTEDDVGYVRALAPNAISPEERRARAAVLRRRRLDAETPEARATRLKKNADYMRAYRQRRKDAA